MPDGVEIGCDDFHVNIKSLGLVNLLFDVDFVFLLNYDHSTVGVPMGTSLIDSSCNVFVKASFYFSFPVVWYMYWGMRSTGFGIWL